MENIAMEEQPIKKAIHRFAKGNPGRPKGSKNKFSTAGLIEAIRSVEKSEKIDFLKHLVERALKSDKMAVSLIKKILPDLTHELGDQEKTLIINYQQAKQVEAPMETKNAEIVSKDRCQIQEILTGTTPPTPSK